MLLGFGLLINFFKNENRLYSAILCTCDRQNSEIVPKSLSVHTNSA